MWVIILVVMQESGLCVDSHLGGRQESGLCVDKSSWWSAGIRRVWVVISVVGRNPTCAGGHSGGQQESGVCGWSSR